MDKKQIVAVAYSILTIFILTIILTCVFILYSFKIAPPKIRGEFKTFVKFIENANMDTLSQNHNKSALYDVITKNEHIAALLVSFEGATQIVYPRQSPLIRKTTDKKAILLTSSPFITTLTQSVITNDDKKLNVTVAMYLLHPKDIYQPVRIAFLVIFIATGILFVFLIYISAQSEEQITKIYAPIAQNETILHDQEHITSIPLPVQTEQKKTFSINDPMGLFSETTGVGWESYMEPRLDAELIRSASSEQDLTLIIIRMEGMTSTNPLRKKIASVLIDFFKFKDFVFEFNADGFAGFLLNMNLDGGMKLAEKMYTEIKSLLTKNRVNGKVAIGLSARNLRLLPGNTLINEASQALTKAMQEDDAMNIVAFKVNPDKYRQFIADSLHKQIN